MLLRNEFYSGIYAPINMMLCVSEDRGIIILNNELQECMRMSEKINYVEFPASNIRATKVFFENCFSWKFEDYGPEYSAFSNAGLEGGFFKSDKASSTENGSALVVLYSEDILSALEKVKSCGGEIVQEIFEFPGGCRFHFKEPSGNELAVWSSKVPEAY